LRTSCNKSMIASEHEKSSFTMAIIQHFFILSHHTTTAQSCDTQNNSHNFQRSQSSTRQ
jgi:hypothetical protein